MTTHISGNIFRVPIDTKLEGGTGAYSLGLDSQGKSIRIALQDTMQGLVWQVEGNPLVMLNRDMRVSSPGGVLDKGTIVIVNTGNPENRLAASYTRGRERR